MESKLQVPQYLDAHRTLQLLATKLTTRFATSKVSSPVISSCYQVP